MPPAIIAAGISGLVGIAGMVNQNVQNKAAIKNNQNQQASSVANAQAATKNAQQQLGQYNAGNPAPTSSPIATPANVAGGAPINFGNNGARGTASNGRSAVSPLIQKALTQFLPAATQAQGQPTQPGGMTPAQIQAIMAQAAQQPGQQMP